MARSKVVFLDRDGVITRVLNERGPRETATTADELELLPNVREALQLLKEQGFMLIVITNQPNVAKGKSTWEEAHAIDKRFHKLLGPTASVDAIYACHHHPDATQVLVPELLKECDCRKPKPGLILQAAQEYGIDTTSAWLVGDAETDIAAGEAAGIPAEHCILIGNSNECKAQDLWAAAHIIINAQQTH